MSNRMEKEDLNKILEEHKLWLEDNTKGERADLSFADLSRADLTDANLTGADLTGADLTGVKGYLNKTKE